MNSLRQKVYERLQLGGSVSDVARRFNVARMIVYHVRERFEATRDRKRSGMPPQDQNTSAHKGC